ncbi:MAG TPA: Gfo/Idh/MocA family oxidoreductase [Bryobacteraceae bacterium]|nr:Gfo/Idh/MocA family oxidoreductase [Bryobacteraceae bacterium]
MNRTRMAVVGCGQFGRNHCRVVHESERAELAAVVDADGARAAEMASFYVTQALAAASDLAGRVDAAVVAVPTTGHEEVACALMAAGIDVLVEKPIASGLEEASRMVECAGRFGRVLQVGHLERFNPAVVELERRATLPLFFEIHRMNQFSPRSLDVDVVLDLMIHDVDIVLGLAGAEPVEIRAAGIKILSEKVDIANVRLQFANGCVANLTASRVSTERVRKLRLFQPQQYLSLDYGRQDLAIFSVNPAGGKTAGATGQIGFEQALVAKSEPLKLQLDAFLNAVETRNLVKCSGPAARQTLGVALAILDKIEEHSAVVSRALVAGWKR